MRVLRRSLRWRRVGRDSRRGRALRPRDRQFLERCYLQGSAPPVHSLALVAVPVLRGVHQELRQSAGALLPHAAGTMPKLKGAHLAPLPSRRVPDRDALRPGSLRIRALPLARVGARSDLGARGARWDGPRAPVVAERDRGPRNGRGALVVGGNRSGRVVGLPALGCSGCGGALRTSRGLPGWDGDGGREDGVMLGAFLGPYAALVVFLGALWSVGCLWLRV